MKRTLLLNKDYSALTFLNEKRTLKFLAIEYLYNDKIEIVSTWDDKIKILDQELNFPATIRLKNQIKRSYRPLIFSKRSILIRDENKCQFCNRYLKDADATIDHLVPKSKGGKTSFLNCVISCFICNNLKGSKTLEECGLKLIKEPIHPKNYNHNPFYDTQIHSWHEDWNYWKR